VLTVKLLTERFPSKRSLKPADCLIVEDAPTVIREVKRIGFPALAVATSYPSSDSRKRITSCSRCVRRKCGRSAGVEGILM
jgi:beta-phosphoglucomutase-like phosphatase (HAD superfamily)